MHVTSKNLDYHVIGCCCYDRMDQSGSLFFAKKKQKYQWKPTAGRYELIKSIKVIIM